MISVQSAIVILCIVASVFQSANSAVLQNIAFCENRAHSDYNAEYATKKWATSPDSTAAIGTYMYCDPKAADAASAYYLCVTVDTSKTGASGSIHKGCVLNNAAGLGALKTKLLSYGLLAADSLAARVKFCNSANNCAGSSGLSMVELDAAITAGSIVSPASGISTTPVQPT